MDVPGQFGTSEILTERDPFVVGKEPYQLLFFGLNSLER